jgi:L-ascorbate metabolism protein UlaG (beta-lactamase superfamily)
VVEYARMGRIVKAAAAAATIGAAGLIVERTLFASPHYRGPVTDHFDGEHFRNLDPAWREQGSFLKWIATREEGFWPRWIDAEPAPPPPERVGGGRMQITLVNHATLLLQVENLNILTDPIWSERCSPFAAIGPRRHRAPGIRFRDLPPIDVVLVSHNHYDHLDLPTLHRLQWRHAPRIVTHRGIGSLLARHGITKTTELDWWRTMRADANVEITSVPSQHFCARAISDRNTSLWGGFVVSTPSGRAYFAGDTGWGHHFAQIGERFAPLRLAMLPIGAFLPRWFMKPVHIDPAEAVEAHRVLGAETSVAMHYGTFHLGDDGEQQPLDELAKALAASGTKNFHVLDHGVGREV